MVGGGQGAGTDGPRWGGWGHAGCRRLRGGGAGGESMKRQLSRQREKWR